MERKTWEFPKNIEFSNVPDYLQQFEKENHTQEFVFNLNETESVHSSFIGFLIHTKGVVEARGGRVVVVVSPAIRRLFRIMNVLDFFMTDTSPRPAGISPLGIAAAENVLTPAGIQ